MNVLGSIRKMHFLCCPDVLSCGQMKDSDGRGQTNIPRKGGSIPIYETLIYQREGHWPGFIPGVLACHNVDIF